MEHLTPVRRSPKNPRSDHVKIRRAAAADKAPILEICKNIWNGHDYLPGVWDDWLADTDGRLIVAAVGGRTVGVAHGSLQTPDVAWLEGVRVHEQYRGLGIAGKLNRALVEWARKRRARVARLCTGSSNLASKKHLAKIGFPLLQTFQRLDSTRGLHVKPANVTRPRHSTKALWNWLSSRPEFIENRAMYSDGWTWHPLTAQAFRRHAAHSRVLLTRRKKQPRACGILLDVDKVLTVGFAAGEPSEVGSLMRMSRFLMLQKRHRKLRVLLPAKSLLVRSLQRSGFEKTGKILVYEKYLE